MKRETQKREVDRKSTMQVNKTRKKLSQSQIVVKIRAGLEQVGVILGSSSITMRTHKEWSSGSGPGMAWECLGPARILCHPPASLENWVNRLVG